MSSRRHEPPPYESRSTQAPGMMRHGSYPMGHQGIEPRPPERGDSTRAAPSSDLERLVSDNQKLATTHVALRQELVATKQDIQKITAHIGSIQTESDNQVRSLLEKIAKMEVQIQAGENVKKELQRAHNEASGLVATRNELINRIDKASQELEKARAGTGKLPEMHAELDGLRQEHQKLRLIFESEKSLNIEKVAELELMDKELMAMAREVEMLRAEVSEAEKKANAPATYSGPYTNQELYPPPPMHGGGGGYVDEYGNYHHVHMGTGSIEGMIPFGGGGGGPRGVVPPGANPHWGPPPQMAPYGVAPPPPPQWAGPPPYNNSRT